MKLDIKKNIAYTKSQLGSNFFVLLFWILTLFAVINSLQDFYVFFNGKHTVLNFILFLFSEFVYYWYFLVLAFVVQFLSKKIPFQKISIVKWLAIHLTTLLVSFTIHQSMSLGIDLLLPDEKWKGSSLFYKMFNNPAFWIEILGYSLLLLTFYLIEYKRKNQENKIRCSQLEIKIIQSRLNELRSKIHPQFLFNTLNTISLLIQKRRNKDANKILSLLSDFLRILVYENESEEIILNDEINFLNKYLEIEKESFKNDFYLREEIQPETLNAFVPNFFLQPIVEEILYGLIEHNNSKYEIIINALKATDISAQKDRLKITIEVLCEQMAKKFCKLNDEESIIINITRKRLFQLYENEQELKMINSDKGSVIVQIEIPFHVELQAKEIHFVEERYF